MENKIRGRNNSERWQIQKKKKKIKKKTDTDFWT